MTNIKTEVIAVDQISVTNYFADLEKVNIRKEILKGLTAKQKYISSKYFYDDKGSKLFEEITHLTEYYPTRTEKGILKKFAPELMSHIKHTDIIELGSGDCSKISILLNAVKPENFVDIKYIPIDVSQSAIQESAEKLVDKFPDLTIHGLVADFIHQMDLIPNNNRCMFCFLGSTLGNFDEKISHDLLYNLSTNMKSGDTFLLGLDMVKPIEILHSAYNDSKGITAQFNKNILSVVNKIIQSDFNQNDFEHKAFFNKEKLRIEMHLIANKDLSVVSPFSKSKIIIKKGENIHTENSYKFSIDRINELEQITNLKIQKVYTDENNWFALVLFEK